MKSGFSSEKHSDAYTGSLLAAGHGRIGLPLLVLFFPAIRNCS